MRHLKFVLSALVILLAGALAAGFAARAVVAPQAGEVVSAGVVSVPSVLGQTADEVLFYPWPVYDMQTLSPISEEALDKYNPEGSSYPFDLFAAIAAMDALGAEFDMEQLVRSQQVYDGKGMGAGHIELRYAKDFPAVLDDVPVLLNYAQSVFNPSAVSWLMQPAEETELFEEQQREALEKVQNDLAGLIYYNLLEPDRNYFNDLTMFLERFNVLQDSALMFYEWLSAWMELMYVQYNEGFEMGFTERQGMMISSQFAAQTEMGPHQEPPPYSLEELLAMGNGEYVDVQFISTPRQVVLLFTLDSGRIIGVYYDIQLGRYSGLGLSGG